MELNGKIAIVTGAGQGIGAAIALELARNGANVALTDIRQDTIEKMKKEIEGIGGEALAIHMDVSKWEDAQRMAERTLERFGRIDILVNNAGINQKGERGTHLGVLDIGDEDWDHLMNINLKGVFNCSKAVIPAMINQRSGKIINMGSITGLTGGAGSPAPPHYCVSKAGIICLTKVLAREFAQYNINVNNIAPGRILTEMAERTAPELNEELRRITPLGRFGKPSDIGRAVLFLVSESGDFITGETLVIDGGRTMH